MSELLIHKQGRGDPTDSSDWQPFDVVVIRPDGWSWGTRETDGITFLLVKLPGVAVATIKHFTEQVHEARGGRLDLQMIKRRKFGVRHTNLLRSIKNQLDLGPNGEIRSAIAEIRVNNTSRFVDAVLEK